jgi:hypothetical protein
MSLVAASPYIAFAGPNTCKNAVTVFAAADPIKPLAWDGATLVERDPGAAFVLGADNIWRCRRAGVYAISSRVVLTPTSNAAPWAATVLLQIGQYGRNASASSVGGLVTQSQQQFSGATLPIGDLIVSLSATAALLPGDEVSVRVDALVGSTDFTADVVAGPPTENSSISFQTIA